MASFQSAAFTFRTLNGGFCGRLKTRTCILYFCSLNIKKHAIKIIRTLPDHLTFFSVNSFHGVPIYFGLQNFLSSALSLLLLLGMANGLIAPSARVRLLSGTTLSSSTAKVFQNRYMWNMPPTGLLKLKSRAEMGGNSYPQILHGVSFI